MSSAQLQSVTRAAPVIAALVLLGLIMHRPYAVRAHPGADVYFSDVESAVKTIPYKIGQWLGRDASVAPAAVRLLKPNVIFQREYTHLETGRVIQLLVVHCGDTRDMQGHYPPVCYPAHGWTEEERRLTSVVAAGQSLPATHYTFRRVDDGVATTMRIINLFIMPQRDAQFYADMSALTRASQDIRSAGLGAAQVQLVTVDPRLDLEETDVANLFMSHLEPALDVIASGANATGD